MRVDASQKPFYVRWRSSPLIAQVEALPAGTVVYSNLPGQLWAVTGRHVLALPDPRLPPARARTRTTARSCGSRAATSRATTVSSST